MKKLRQTGKADTLHTDPNEIRRFGTKRSFAGVRLQAGAWERGEELPKSPHSAPLPEAKRHLVE